MKNFEYMNRMKIRSIEKHIQSTPALRRLMVVTQWDTCQSSRVEKKILLGQYNGCRFKYNLNNLQGIDTETFEDCVNVLRMDVTPKTEVLKYFNDPNPFENRRWRMDWLSTTAGTI